MQRNAEKLSGARNPSQHAGQVVFTPSRHLTGRAAYNRVHTYGPTSGFEGGVRWEGSQLHRASSRSVCTVQETFGMLGKADEKAEKVRVWRTRTLLLETKVGQAAVPGSSVVGWMEKWHGIGRPICENESLNGNPHLYFIPWVCRILR